jgi:hypothetical protein
LPRILLDDIKRKKSNYNSLITPISNSLITPISKQQTKTTVKSLRLGNTPKTRTLTQLEKKPKLTE